MTKLPSITIIIINWNSWKILAHCLERLQSQTFRNFDVLVIDNASDTPVPNGLLSLHPNVTLIQNQSNVGFAAANNQAMKLLDKSERLIFLNPDCFPEPDWLERLIDVARKNPDYSMFASRPYCACFCCSPVSVTVHRQMITVGHSDIEQRVDANMKPHLFAG